MAKRKPFDLDRAVVMYQEDNLPTSQIAKKFNIHLQTVINRFKEAGVSLKPQGKAASLVDKDKIKKDHENGLSTKDIGIKHSISTFLVRKKLLEYGIRVKPSGGKHRAISIDQEKLIKMYCDQLITMKKCAKYFNVSNGVIKRHLKILKIDTRPSTKNTLTDIKNETIVDLYWNKKLSIAQTAKKLNRSCSFVKKRLAESGKGTRSVTAGARLWRGSDEVSDDKLIYLYDICGWSCEKISKHFNKSSPFTLSRFRAIGKKRRKNIGKNNGSWKGGITDLRNAIRSCAASLQWRKDAFKKQKNKSEISGKRGWLNCHHIYPFHIILQSSLTKHKPLPDEYRSLAIMADNTFYDLGNSLIVTKDEHDEIEKGRFNKAHPWWKIWKSYPDFALTHSGLTNSDFNMFESDGQINCEGYTIGKSTKQEIRNIIRYEHYIGTVPSSKLILVARHKNIIIGIATFGLGSNKYMNKDTWQLTRLCIPFYVLRPFGCTFLNSCCEYIQKQHSNIKHILSFADPSVGHNGGIYRMAGWYKAGKTQPSYAYFDPKTLQLRHKSSCRRIKGIDKTEKQLAEDRSLIKIPLVAKYRYMIDL